MLWSIVVLCSVSILQVFCDDAAKYLDLREKLLYKDYSVMMGSELRMSDSEMKANEIIMRLKHEVWDIGYKDPGLFNMTKHFFDYKEELKETALFKLIKAMPKGAVLHAHDTGLLGPDYVLGVTYLPNLYVCFQEHYPLFMFSDMVPHSDCETQWQSMKDARYSSGNVQKFDAELRKHFTIVVDKPKQVYTDVNIVWNKFQSYFIVVQPLLTYKPVWEQYFYDTLKAFWEDNVMYIEVRSVLPHLYELDGTVYDVTETAESYKNVLEKFQKYYPDFYGAKLIYAPNKFVDNKGVREYMEIARVLKDRLGDFFAGFDLVGQEDIAKPLKDFLPELIQAKGEFNFYFHAGETNWYGATDENIVDAIVLESKRIGHAFALIKHPVLLEEVLQRDIGLEINVVSNHVLKLVDDVRNHPLAVYLAMDAPVVISSDDPGVWEADPLSHDFYITFVGVASRNADLRLLKKLALNSIAYSAVSDKNKMNFDFEIRWTKFIDSVVKNTW